MFSWPIWLKRESVCVVWRALVAPRSLYQTLCSALDQMSSWYSDGGMVGLDRVAVGMDVDAAAGVEHQRHALRTNGSARSAAVETGGVVRNADIVRVSRTVLWSCRRPRSRRRLQSWRRRYLVVATTSLV